MPKKMSRAERKAEEARIIAEMDEAMAALKHSDSGKEEPAGAARFGAEAPSEGEMLSGKDGAAGGKTAGNETVSGVAGGGAEAQTGVGEAGPGGPSGRRCPKCGGEVKRGVCSRCGHYEYVPPDEKTVRKIRLVVGGICVALFLVWMLINSIKG